MDIAEKRVFDETEGRTRLAVATGAGLAVVGISADVIGEFGLATREPVRDVAAAGEGRLLVATEGDVQAVTVAEGEDVAATELVVETGAGAADAVAVHGGAAIAAGSDGVVRRAELEADGALDWTPIGEAEVRSADGGLLAAADGVYRVGDGAGGADGGAEIRHVGLDDARDVAAVGPFAATGDGLFRLGPGWTRDLDGVYDVVAASPDGDRAHAGVGDELVQRTDDGWAEADWPPAAPVADLAYGEATYAVAADGTVLADAGERSDGSRSSSDRRSDGGDGWRTRSIGLPDVRHCVVVA